MGDTESTVLILGQVASNVGGLVSLPHRRVENPGLLCSGPDIGDDRVEVVVLAETPIWP